MSKNYMKKVAVVLIVLVTLFVFGSFSLGTDGSIDDSNVTVQGGSADSLVDLGVAGSETIGNNTDANEDNTNESLEDADLNSASDKILNNKNRSDDKKAYYIDKYNDKFLGMVAYYLDIIRLYSLPICFIGITIGSFNFLIMGNKKLDKKEQGFGWIVGFTIGLVVFNVLPLLYALLVISR